MNTGFLKRVYYLSGFIISLFAAFYLMFYLDEITLETNMQRIFIWIYFFISLFILLHFLSNKMITFMKQHKVILITGFFVSIIWVCFSGSTFLPKQYVENQVEIKILNSKNINAQGQEVWINAIKVDSENQPLALFANNSDGWNLNGDALFGSYGNSSILNLILPSGKNIELVFGMHTWSGEIEVRADEFQQQFDLYCEEGADYAVDILGKSMPYSGMFYWILWGGYLSFSTIALGMFLYMFLKYTCKNDVKQ